MEKEMVLFCFKFQMVSKALRVLFTLLLGVDIYLRPPFLLLVEATIKTILTWIAQASLIIKIVCNRLFILF